MLLKTSIILSDLFKLYRKEKVFFWNITESFWIKEMSWYIANIIWQLLMIIISVRIQLTLLYKLLFVSGFGSKIFISLDLIKKFFFFSEKICIYNNWDKLAIFQSLLTLFYWLSIRFEENNKTGTNCAIWESLVYIDIIHKHLKKNKTKFVQNQALRSLATSINNALILSWRYFSFIFKMHIYSAALELNATYQ